MDPTPPKERVWTLLSYTSLWVSDAFNIPSVSNPAYHESNSIRRYESHVSSALSKQWELASASIAVGLGWRQALPAVALGHLIIALAITANGTIGARLHVPFPVLNRSSFGFWFSYFTVISR